MSTTIETTKHKELNIINMNKDSFLGLIEQSIRVNWDRPAMTDYEGTTFHYKDFAREIDKLHEFFKAADIQPGDKISICGRNSARWGITFFATLAYGAVAVSILHEFNTESVEYIVNHSDSKMFFADESIWKDVDASKMPQVETAISLDDFSLMKVSSKELKAFETNAFNFFEEKYSKGFFADDLQFIKEDPEQLAVINYTSGTTSSPKGVMIPFRSLWSNTKFANDNLEFILPGDNIVCMLPMAHTYGLAFEILNSISMGCHIHFLGKTPSPRVLLSAFSKINPKLVLAVPLIIEKIVTRNVFPELEKNPAKTLLKIPGLRNIVYNKVRKQLINTFGDKLDEVVIGGAALNEDVEKFLRKIKFPYTVGYGMTECGPLISYAYWDEFKERSCGKIVDRMEVKIDSSDPVNEVGEILTRGANLMLGYYKNEEATKETFTEDGWLKTGDLGVLDKDNHLFIRGRNKEMILGPSGQNIYPEEIEDKMNNSPHVIETLAIEENQRIVALIVPDKDALKAEGIAEEMFEEFFVDFIKEVNTRLPVYSKIASFRIMDEEFEKTPKRSIRRFKYQK